LAAIFASAPGTVSVLDGDGMTGLPVAIDGLAGAWYPPFKAIITSVSIALDGNYQFTHTLDDVIYVYAFGDRISQLRIDGMAFTSNCNEAGGTGGIEAILDAYAANRIAARDEPIQIQIGTSVSGRFRGYLTGLRNDIARPDERIGTFSFLFHIIPNNAGSASGGNGGQTTTGGDAGGGTDTSTVGGVFGNGGGGSRPGGFVNPGIGPTA
jgi:hypothetical protein